MNRRGFCATAGLLGMLANGTQAPSRMNLKSRRHTAAIWSRDELFYRKSRERRSYKMLCIRLI